MAAIAATLVKQLRDRTGQSMMDCKKQTAGQKWAIYIGVEKRTMIEQLREWFIEERAGAEKAQMDAAMKLMRQKLSG